MLNVKNILINDVIKRCIPHKNWVLTKQKNYDSLFLNWIKRQVKNYS